MYNNNLSFDVDIVEGTKGGNAFTSGSISSYSFKCTLNEATAEKLIGQGKISCDAGECQSDILKYDVTASEVRKIIVEKIIQDQAMYMCLEGNEESFHEFFVDKMRLLIQSELASRFDFPDLAITELVIDRKMKDLSRTVSSKKAD